MYADTYFTETNQTLSEKQALALDDFVTSGKGFFGLHTACACYLNSTTFTTMLNVEFGGHTTYMDFSVHVNVTDPLFADAHNFMVADELYTPHIVNQSVSTIAVVSYDPSSNTSYPSALYHNHGEGRVFYLALGHDLAEFTQNANFLDLVMRGLEYVVGS